MADICQELKQLTLERCSYIPSSVHGAAWHMLQETVVAHPEFILYKVLARPWHCS